MHAYTYIYIILYAIGIRMCYWPMNRNKISNVRKLRSSRETHTPVWDP